MFGCIWCCRHPCKRQLCGPTWCGSTAARGFWKILLCSNSNRNFSTIQPRTGIFQICPVWAHRDLVQALLSSDRLANLSRNRRSNRNDFLNISQKCCRHSAEICRTFANNRSKTTHPLIFANGNTRSSIAAHPATRSARNFSMAPNSAAATYNSLPSSSTSWI